MSYIEQIARANVKLFHGKYDPGVPFSHSQDLFDAVNRLNPRARVYLDIFDGSHETDDEAVLHWLISQYRKKENAGVTG